MALYTDSEFHIDCRLDPAMGHMNPDFVEACVSAFREYGAPHYPGVNWDNVSDHQVYIFAQWVARGCPDNIRPTKAYGQPETIVPLTPEELIAYFEKEKENE